LSGKNLSAGRDPRGAKWIPPFAEYINGISNEILKKFIGNAFYLTNDTAEGVSNLTNIIFKANARYLELLPALRAGNISFDCLCDILATEIGVGDEACHA